MSEPKRPLKVFLSHAHSDQRVVRELYYRLKKDGVDAWLDKEEIVGGQHFEREIRKAVQNSDVVVVCLSKEFNRAGFRQREVKWALDAAMNQPEGEIFIIPLRLEECDTLDSLSELHWVDYFEDDGYERLLRALRARADRIDVTLQIKKIWLPNVITSPRRTQQRPVSNKRPATSTRRHKLNTAIVVALIGFLGTTIAGLLGSPLIDKWLVLSTSELMAATMSSSLVPTNAFLTPTFSGTAIATNTLTLADVAMAGYTPTETITSTITPTLTVTPTHFLPTSCVWYDKYYWVGTLNSGRDTPLIFDVRWNCSCENAMCACEVYKYFFDNDSFYPFFSTEKDLDWVNAQVKNRYGECKEN